MAVTVDIDNNTVTLNDVATEDTLRRLVAAVEKSGGSTGGVGFMTEAANETKKQTKNIKASTTQLRGLTKSADDLAEELDDAADSAGGFGNKLLGFAGKIADAAEDVIKFAGNTAGAGLNMKQVGGFAEQMASKLPIFGGALGAGAGIIVGHTANLADSFDQLTRTGAAFSGNLFDIERAAAASYLTLEQFGGVIRENSASLAIFGGTAKLGVQRFVELNKGLQDTFRGGLRNLGIGAEESAELLGEYMAMQQRNTSFQGMSVRQQTQAAANFSEEITKLATLTGQDRKALAEKMAREKQAADIELQLSKMTATASADTRAAIELVKQRFGDVPGATDLLAQGFRGLTVGTDTVSNQLLQSPIGQAINEIGLAARNGGTNLETVFKKLDGAYGEHSATMGKLGDLSGVSPFAAQMSQAELAAQGFQQQISVLNKDFKGNMEAYMQSLLPNPEEITKDVKKAQMLVEDAGRITREGINTFSESVVGPLTAGLGKLKDKLDNFDITDPSTAEAMTTFKTSTVAASGAASGFAKAASEAAKKLATIGLSTADDAAKVAGTVGSTASAGAKVASGATGILSKFLGKLPVIGALVTGGITAAETGSVGEGIGAGGGSFLGGAGGTAAGAAIGTMVFPGVGTAIGAVLGGLLGSFAGEAAGQGVASGGERFGTIGKLFGFEEGGVIRQPTLGMIGEGTSDEAVVPLPNNRNIPVDMDMSAITNLAKSDEKLVEQGNLQRDNTEVVTELKKLNKQTGKVVTLQS